MPGGILKRLLKKSPEHCPTQAKPPAPHETSTSCEARGAGGFACHRLFQEPLKSARFWRAVCLSGVLAVLAVIPTRWVELAPSVCVFKRYFGVSCLGCGMTRALSALLHADLAKALAYNKLVVLVLPALCAAVVWDASMLAATVHKWRIRRLATVPSQPNAT